MRTPELVLALRMDPTAVAAARSPVDRRDASMARCDAERQADATIILAVALG